MTHFYVCARGPLTSQAKYTDMLTRDTPELVNTIDNHQKRSELEDHEQKSTMDDHE